MVWHLQCKNQQHTTHLCCCCCCIRLYVCLQDQHTHNLYYITWQINGSCLNVEHCSCISGWMCVYLYSERIRTNVKQAKLLFPLSLVLYFPAFFFFMIFWFALTCSVLHTFCSLERNHKKYTHNSKAIALFTRSKRMAYICTSNNFAQIAANSLNGSPFFIEAKAATKRMPQITVDLQAPGCLR